MTSQKNKSHNTLGLGGPLSGETPPACTPFINRLKNAIKISRKLMWKLKIFSTLRGWRIWRRAHWREVRNRIRLKMGIRRWEKSIFRTRNSITRGFYHARLKEDIISFRLLKDPIFIKALQPLLVKAKKSLTLMKMLNLMIISWLEKHSNWEKTMRKPKNISKEWYKIETVSSIFLTTKEANYSKIPMKTFNKGES